ARLAAILAGDVDITLDGLNGTQAATLDQQWQTTGAGRVLVTEGPLYYFAFQFAPDIANPRVLMEDPRLRAALYLAIDRGALTDLAYGGRPSPEGEAKSMMPSSDPLYSYVKDAYA